MAAIHSTRSRFDKYSYWLAFIFVACFVAYFLTSMIHLADKEDNNYNAAMLENYQDQNAIVKAHRSTSDMSVGVDASGNVTVPE